MMPGFARTDHSVFGRWWWTVDRWTLAALAVVIALGVFLVAAASPAVAERIGLPSMFFVVHHAIMLVPTIFLMIGISLMSPKGVRRLAMVLMLATLFGMLLTLVPGVGVEIKGARRWIHFGSFSVQVSEFLKPAFAVVCGWVFSRRHVIGYSAYAIATGLYAVVAALLLLQPDLGMTVVITAIWLGEFFLAGLPLILMAALAVFAVCGLVGAYFTFPHVQSRIDRFLNPASGDTYQIDRSIEAFRHGGIFGTGPGQGQVKNLLPDAHADFIFAVAGEELGLIATVLIVSLFAFIVIRGLTRVMKESDLFIVLAASGLLIQFGLQALIHMGSSLHLLPAKGMTLPFISYGGSSMLALGIGTGMMLALTRKRFSPQSQRQVLQGIPR
jgi:cell division protein FtsW